MKHSKTAPDCCSYDNRPIMKISWQSIHRCFRYTNTHDAVSSMRPWNSLVGVKQTSHLFGCESLTNLEKKYIKIRSPLFFLLANTDPENTKIYPGSKVLNVTSLISSRLFAVLCPENFMKTHSSVLIAMLQTDRDPPPPQKKKKKKKKID